MLEGALEKRRGWSWRALTPRCPPTRPKRRGRGFGRGGGRGGADWATCLSLLERAAAAASDVACDGAASRRRRVCGGVSLRSGRRTERDKKIEKKRLCLTAAYQ